MEGLNVAQPDITLHLDMEGTIQRVSHSAAIPDSDVESLRGRAWSETVGDVGGDKIKHMLEDARDRGISAFRQLNQHFPSGLKLPIEYTAVRLGDNQGLVAIGRNLQAVAELQSRLVAAQQAMERDYWKLREVETRYRLLFDSSNEAVLLIRASTLHIVEANPVAIRALGVSAQGGEFLAEIAAKERQHFEDMLQRVRDQGKAPAVMIHMGQDQTPWLVRASLMTAGPGPMYLLQLSPVSAEAPASLVNDTMPIADLIARVPDAFVVLDKQGTVLRTNQAFLDLVQAGSEAVVVGERLSRWLWRPGADLTVLLANIQLHGTVRLFSTTVHGDLGLETEVELSASGDRQGDPQHIGVLIRDVSRRLVNSTHGRELSTLVSTLTEQIGSTSLRDLVRDTVGVVERHYIESALELTNGNRTAAAELLGLSRQSLYAKLNRYAMDGGTQSPSDNKA
ncbi:transcriptional regulator PpsR [Pelagibius sp.]|uniref:transcriptional regulator PpsR n=1 Tax=Pelagibius sp. TaxID=1931238 RepID=UPI003B50E5E4